MPPENGGRQGSVSLAQLPLTSGCDVFVLSINMQSLLTVVWGEGFRLFIWRVFRRPVKVAHQTMGALRVCFGRVVCGVLYAWAVYFLCLRK